MARRGSVSRPYLAGGALVVALLLLVLLPLLTEPGGYLVSLLALVALASAVALVAPPRSPPAPAADRPGSPEVRAAHTSGDGRDPQPAGPVDANRPDERALVMAEASKLVADSLDYESTLRSLTRVLVPRLADSCFVYLLDRGGTVERFEVVHADYEKEALLRRHLETHPPRRDTLIRPVAEALEAGRSTLLVSVTSRALKRYPLDESHRSIAEAVELASLMVVPLRSRGRILGALTLGRSPHRSPFGDDDLGFAEELASRAGVAIDNAELYRAATEALQARNTVLGFVSHDLRNPLNVVRMGTRAILRHWPPQGDGQLEKHQLEVIARATDRMHHLIRDLLEVTQLEGGHLPLNRTDTTIEAIFQEASELLTPLARERSVVLTFETAPDLPSVAADPARIAQVLANLVDNAFKYSPTWGLVTVAAAPHGSDEVVVSVSDAGPGIEPEHVDRIFDQFWSARGSASGTGLGLTIAKGIVEAHGGRIWVDTRLREGTTFHFTLPAQTTRAEVEAEPPA